MEELIETCCGCEYDGINEDGRIEWRTANCDEHGPKANQYKES